MTNNVLCDALLGLEKDFVLAGTGTTGREYYQSLEEDMGYSHEDEYKLRWTIPCYKCLGLRDADLVPDCGPLQIIAKEVVVAVAPSSLMPTRLVPSRTCFYCHAKSPDFLNNLNKPGCNRWQFCRIISFGLDRTCWMLLCANCNGISSTRGVPAPRRFLAELCNDCWRTSHPKWSEFNDTLEQRHKDLGAEIERLQKMRTAIGQYQTWMVLLDLGEGITDTEPPRLEEHLKDVEVPEWRDIRPDARTKLPGPPWTKTGAWGYAAYVEGPSRSVKGGYVLRTPTEEEKSNQTGRKCSRSDFAIVA